MPRTEKATRKKVGIGFGEMVEASQDRAAGRTPTLQVETRNYERNNERDDVNIEVKNDEIHDILTHSYRQEEASVKEGTTDAEYTENSSIKWAYNRGEMPKRHRDLYEALKLTLKEQIDDSATAGDIQLENALKKAKMKRYSAAQIMKHLQHFGYIQYEGKYRRTWVKILK